MAIPMGDWVRDMVQETTRITFAIIDINLPSFTKFTSIYHPKCHVLQILSSKSGYRRDSAELLGQDSLRNLQFKGFATKAWLQKRQSQSNLAMKPVEPMDDILQVNQINFSLAIVAEQTRCTS